MWLRNRNKKGTKYEYLFTDIHSNPFAMISSDLTGISGPILINIAISIDASINHPGCNVSKPFRSNTATDHPPLIQQPKRSALATRWALHNRGDTLFAQLAIIGRQVDPSLGEKENVSLLPSSSLTRFDRVLKL